MSLTYAEKWRAFMERDQNYDGIFYTAVKTTGIFCKPSCRARKQLEKNVIFYNSVKEAKENGFRACKICEPEGKSAGDIEGIVDELRAFIISNSANEIDFTQYAEHCGLSMSHLIRVFKRQYGITPRAYLTKVRIEQAKKCLSETEAEIVKIAYDVGFMSLSSFYKHFKALTGKSPRAYHEEKKSLKRDRESKSDDEIILKTPDDFNYAECLVYLDRSELESLHKVKDGALTKLIICEGQKCLIQIEPLTHENQLKITLLNKPLENEQMIESIRQYVEVLFDFKVDLTSFYALADQDKIAKLLIEKYRGLRIVKINDLFEGFCWSIIGQQINLKFAYTLKKRLVEAYGECIEFKGERYYLFPEPKVIAELSVETLKSMQFTKRKAEYLIGIATLFCQGDLDEDRLKQIDDYKALKEILLKVRGIGNWTADYIMLKCFNMSVAFPIADIGIHNALKGILNLMEKPSIDEIEAISKVWHGHEAYMTFYLWRYLYD